METDLRFILVDDEPLVLKGMQRLMKRVGLPHFATTNAKEAMAQIELAPPIAVVTDHHMPDITGLELLAFTKRHAPSSMRLLTTGNPSMSMLADAINRCHVHFYFEKPLSMDALLGRLVRLFEQATKPPPAPPPTVIKNSAVHGDELFEAAIFLNDALGLKLDR